MTKEDREESVRILKMLIPKNSRGNGKAKTNIAVTEAILNAIEALKQEPKTGHWIMHLDDLFPMESTMECSECGEHQPLTIDDNYCPNCGARMSEVKEWN